ncbi:MAG: hypothetical protein L0I62_07405 [Gammaproteobacteria bacterium]|nr:hypothetical protein [Gammaproteobacteria bacterium]
MQPTIAVDIGAFAGLFVLSSLIRRRFKHRGYSATGAGGIVMSTGVFTAFAFTQLPMYTPLLGRLATIEIFVIWLFLAWSFGSSFVNRHFRMHYAHPLRRFAMGTWVAGTAVLATLATRSMPEAIWFSRVLALVAVAIYLPYVVLFVQGYAQLWRHPLQQRANGVILLATVSTQSIVLALHANFGGSFPVGIEIGLVAFDVVFLCSGLVLIALHYHAVRSWFLAIEWKNANCIIHGAVSITGLALVLTSNFGGDVIFGVWQVALVLFVLIEAIEFIRMSEREHRRGLRPGLLVYDVTQWTRNFTFGMFYAFSLELYQNFSKLHSVESDFWFPLLQAIAHWGHYAVLAALVIEITLFLRARLHLFWPKPHHA